MSWQDVPIKDVCELAVDCVNKTAPVVDYETPYRMLRTTNVRGGFVDAKNTRFVTEETFIKWTRRGIPKKGDVILTREAPLGDVGRLTSDNTVFLGQRLFMYRADPKKLDSAYLAYVLQSPLVQGRIKSKGFGATVEHARVGDCENLLIPLPDLNVQEEIGKILSAYDDLIENNKRRIELLEESARQLYKEWFVRFRFPGHEHVKIIDGVPEGWVKNTFGNVAHIIKGKNITKDKAISGNVPVVAGGLKPAYYHNKANTEKPVVTISASGANAGFVNIYLENVWASDCSYIDSSYEQPVYFYYLMLKVRQTEITAMQKGAAQPHVYPKDLMRLEVILPPKRLLDEFLGIVTDSFNIIENLQNQNKYLTQARDLLLPKLMNGEIAV